ncbi:hypothetical protein FJY71_05150, partial [candidate division WOR-3 bacterium]|nr:hypothetical protein [candidate division WOR-3 bacterium]
FVFDGFEQLEVGGASVLVIGTTGSREVTAGSHGDYVVDGLEPGDYEVEVQAPGYSPETYPEPIAVEAGVVASFISPALYPFTGTAEPRSAQPQPRLAASPNPFSGATRIRFAPASRATGLLVLDRAGRIVRTLGAKRGTSSVVWDGRDDSGRRVAEGIYFCRLNAAEADAWVKVVVTR